MKISTSCRQLTHFLLLALSCFVLPLNAQVDAECENCQVGIITYTPPIPTSGVYAAGTEVTISLLLTNWFPVNNDWPHTAYIEAGAGFDPESVEYFTPQICSGTGYWYYEPLEWNACYSGAIRPPGITFESVLGIGCGGIPDDGNPGNNWGDGDFSNCLIEFQWRFTTRIPPEGSCPNTDFIAHIEVAADRETGSWNGGNPVEFFDQTACEPGPPQFGLQAIDQNGTLLVAAAFGTADSCNLNHNWTVLENGSELLTSTEPTVPYSPLYDYILCIDNGTCAPRCSTTLTPIITDLPPNLYVSPSDEYCIGEEVLLIAVGGDFFHFITPGGDTISQAENGLLFLADSTVNGVWQVDIFRSGVLLGSFTVTIIVAEPAEFTILQVPEFPVLGDTIVFTLVPGNINEVIWSLDTFPAQTGFAYSVVPPDTGFFRVSLSMRGQLNCRYFDDYEFYVAPSEDPVPVAISLENGPAVCEQDSVRLSVAGAPATSYLFTGPGGQTATTDVPLYVFSAADDNVFGYWHVTVFADGEAVGTDSVFVDILAGSYPAASVNGTIDGEFVALFPITFTASGSGGSGIYEWLINGTVLSGQSVSYTFLLPGTYSVNLLGITGKGCVGTFDTIFIVRAAMLDDGPLPGPGGQFITGAATNWQLSPNPTSGKITIVLPEGINSATISMVIYNQRGQIVKQLEATDFATSILFDLSDQPSGVYFLRAYRKATDDSLLYSGRIIVVNE